MRNLIHPGLLRLRAQIDEIVKDLHELTIRIGHEDLAKTVSDLRNRIHEPFMFVIVGEVKSGKSSFINALLATGKEIARVAPQPMTDTIQQIIYGEEEQTIPINPFLKKILLPVEILKEIAIVDTPGTNTIIEHHQEITESFIPASDLIVFVFEAKNPYRKSAWDFFDFIHADWRKKIIFVLQQKDLMPEEDLAVNEKGLKEYAEKKGIAQPRIFSVSAKLEQEEKTQESGFGPLRTYIAENITGGKAPALKLENNIATSVNINQRILKGLNDRLAQWKSDLAFRQDIRQTLEEQEQQSDKHVDILVENMIAGYDRITQKKEEELRSGLSFFALVRRSISSVFRKKTPGPKDWLDNLATALKEDLHEELKKKLNASIADLADSIQQMARIIDLKIRNSKTILQHDHYLFSEIAEKRSNVLQELQETFSRFIAHAENFMDEELFPDKQAISPNVATGSGIAVVGIILTAVTNVMVFDITGGILTAIGLLFAGVSTHGKRRKILEGYRGEIEKGRQRLTAEVTENLKGYISHLKKKIDSNFEGFDVMLNREEKEIQTLQQQHDSIQERLLELEKELEI